MKHFLIDIQYLVPVEELGDILPEHRAFLKTGYEKGLLLLSGPKEPRIGGVAIGRSQTREEMETFFRDDPYHLKNVATHTIIEFNPVLHQSWLEDWIMGS
ncbi:MAG: hypothetical protein GYA15_09360 [Leptolinea sp.]|jgi:uncharacterized protein YciI|nr:hypothetical protein [Leptolinea sp.]